MPGEEAKWGIGFWSVARWSIVHSTMQRRKEDAYTAFLRRFYSDHKVALTGLAELLQLHKEKRKV